MLGIFTKYKGGTKKMRRAKRAWGFLSVFTKCKGKRECKDDPAREARRGFFVMFFTKYKGNTKETRRAKRAGYFSDDRDS